MLFEENPKVLFDSNPLSSSRKNMIQTVFDLEPIIELLIFILDNSAKTATKVLVKLSLLSRNHVSSF